MEPSQKPAPASANDREAAPEPAGLPERPLRELAWETFQRELPELLKEFDGQFVGYHGSQRIAIAPDDREVRAALRALGLASREYVVYQVGEENLGPIRVHIPSLFET